MSFEFRIHPKEHRHLNDIFFEINKDNIEKTSEMLGIPPKSAFQQKSDITYFDFKQYQKYELETFLDLKFLWYIRRDILSSLEHIDYDNLTEKQKLTIYILAGYPIKIEFKDNSYIITTEKKVDISFDKTEQKFLIRVNNDN